MQTQKFVVPVSVIIVSFNTRELTRKALLALCASTVLPAQVIVVDNASKDDTVGMVRAEFPDVIIIENSENVGFAKANNQAMRDGATQPYIWLLNSDTETGSKSLEQLHAYLEAHPRVAVVGPQLVYPSGVWQSVGGYFPTPTNVLFYLLPLTVLFPNTWRQRLKSLAVYPQTIPDTGLTLDYVTGAAALIRRSAVDEVGVLAEDYFMYFEETDLCWRLCQAGWDLMVINTDPVMHVYGGSYKTAYDPKRLRRFLQSLVMFVLRNYSGSRRFVIIWEVRLFGSVRLCLKRLKNFL